MARTKRKTIALKRTKKTEIRAKRVEAKKPIFRFGESYTSVLLGFVVFIIAILFVGSLIKVRHIQDTSSISTVPLPSDTALKNVPTNPKSGTYKVKQGDSLWTIAENAYSDGYKWVDIARANNLTDPDSLNEGTILALPKITKTAPSIISPTPMKLPTNAGIRSSTYVVQKGDSLWDISVRAYADGYKWVDIARANNLTDPDLIFSGNTLKIPR